MSVELRLLDKTWLAYRENSVAATRGVDLRLVILAGSFNLCAAPLIALQRLVNARTLLHSMEV